MAYARTAIITGITGQDGSYLAEFLAEKDYEVIGLVRRTSSGNLNALRNVNLAGIKLEEADLLDRVSLDKVTRIAKADEFYNLAAQSHVASSFQQPGYTLEVNALGVINCLESIRASGCHTRFYQASTSELFGGLSSEPYSEESPFHPRSPYGVAKLAGHWATINYREAYKMYACAGILFNHESPRRGANFVTQKIVQGLAAIKRGTAQYITLGNIDASRDWGHAKDYVEAMWLMLQQSRPKEYVIGMGETYTVREFLQLATEAMELPGDYKDYVRFDPMFYRPSEVNILTSNPTKARTELQWKPKYSFAGLVKEMVTHALQRIPS